jgi:outer membrane protein OmpA-like peptidoglycan-associated protein
MIKSVRQGWSLAVRSVGLATVVLASASAGAQTVMVYGKGQAPSAQEVADILSRGASENVKLRGQMPAGGGASTPFAALEQKPTTKVTEASALSVPVTFGFDSANLTPQARVQLNVIAEGIRMTEGTVKVVIEGHTDAKGRADYNDALSLRRASAVRDYLVQSKGLPVNVLTVEGVGSRKPIDRDPLNPRNRRVQFRAG